MQFRTWLNKLQIEDWFGLWHDFATISFQMKQRVLSKTASFHPLFIKKKSLNDVVLNGTVGLLLPLDALSRGRRSSSLPLSLSLLKLKKTPTQSSHLPKLWPVADHDVEKTEGTCPSDSFWGGCTVAAPTSLSPVFPINTEERL